MYNIEIYEDKNGKSTIKEYIKKLKKQKNKDSKIKFNKIIAYIRELREKGVSLSEKYVKHIKNEIWELRPLRDRILFAYLDNNNFVLLNIFMKKTNKTPQREIQKAQKLLEDYKKRKRYK